MKKVNCKPAWKRNEEAANKECLEAIKNKKLSKSLIRACENIANWPKWKKQAAGVDKYSTLKVKKMPYKKEYTLTIKIPVTGIDDCDVRKKSKKILEDAGIDSKQVKLQEIYGNKEPRKIEL